MHSSNLRDRLQADGHDIATIDFYNSLIPEKSVLSKALTLLLACFGVIAKRMSGYRLIHFHTSNKAPLFYLTTLPLKLSGAKLLLSVHSGLGYDPWLASHPIFEKANRCFFRFLDRLIFMNVEEANRIATRYPCIESRISKVNPFIAPAVDEILLHTAPNNLPFRVVTVGAFIPRYATEETLQACHQLTEKFQTPVELTMILSSAYAQVNYRKSIEKYIKDTQSELLSVNLVVDTQNILATMAGHHAFVRPARGDSYGLCVAEALLLGIPSIATNVCSRCKASDLYHPGDLIALVGWLHERANDLSTAGSSLLTPSEDSYSDYLDIYHELMLA